MRDSFFVFVFVSALLVSILVIGVMELAPGTSAESYDSSRPALHAALNGVCAALILVGWWFIRRKKVGAHMATMILAALVSATFLVSYLQYHSTAGSTKFAGEGIVRPIYFGVLLSHTVLAALVAPLVASLFWFAAKRRFETHRKIARYTVPVWFYVSVTGVLIYYMLHVWFRPA